MGNGDVVSHWTVCGGPFFQSNQRDRPYYPRMGFPLWSVRRHWDLEALTTLFTGAPCERIQSTSTKEEGPLGQPNFEAGDVRHFETDRKRAPHLKS
ncbi:hypothetical protein MRX96_057852 [Rhipicephalus microplus]